MLNKNLSDFSTLAQFNLHAVSTEIFAQLSGHTRNETVVNLPHSHALETVAMERVIKNIAVI